MVMVEARKNESIDSLLRRFKRKVERAGIISDYKRKEYFISPSRARHEAKCKQKFKQKLASRKLERGF